ncbi:hypothetical protein ACFFUT_18585 [Pseudohalocynthiibacter aestuariivivens]|jgi:hypothetical protein|uniref:Lipoprotein n=1 Tax=Pseudohalocynthiibacter aestuariivivens TaxID=1591409 RepID=A0ABV5JLQ2_9RHOB|nr:MULTISPECIES: hypothetical protein [Pseudohalocynthiibacter]MBS9717685.1 hypothetical protein [Pseudohalocynthiibacter aestuariivivens]MCK0102883.1 hypothetical protein [Pseudohalocynthiibacter sp. F2068]
MFKRLLTAGLLFGMAATAPPAHATSCAMRDQVVDRLKSEFSEQLTAGGIQATRSAQTLLEVWASPETGTFTVMLTSPNGVSCIVAAGTDWFHDLPTPEPAGQPS